MFLSARFPDVSTNSASVIPDHVLEADVVKTCEPDVADFKPTTRPAPVSYTHLTLPTIYSV